MITLTSNIFLVFVIINTHTSSSGPISLLPYTMMILLYSFQFKCSTFRVIFRTYHFRSCPKICMSGCYWLWCFLQPNGEWYSIELQFSSKIIYYIIYTNTYIIYINIKYYIMYIHEYILDNMLYAYYNCTLLLIIYVYCIRTILN